MIRKIITSGVAMAAITNLNAQDSLQKSNKPVITGSADVYYRYDLGKNISNNKTSFTNSHNSFELGMVSLKAEHSFGKASMVADIGFGKRAEDFSYNDNNTRLAIKQLNVSYAPTEHLKLTAGSWATHVGYEVVDAYGNRNYSMSYMFSYGPFFHTGVKAEATYGAHGFMLGVTNPTDLKSTTSKFKYLVAQYSTSTNEGKFKGYLNYQGGKSSDSTNTQQFDAVVTTIVSPKFTIGYNGTLAYSSLHPSLVKQTVSKKWWGSALYFNYDPMNWFGLTLRSEYFNDEKQLTPVFSSVSTGGSVLANTLSANFKVSDLTIIPEVRIEKASENIYLTDGNSASKNSASFLVAAVYKF